MGLWDRLVLLTAWIVTCGLVYLLGLYVGKGTRERRPGLEERVVRLPVTSEPPPAGERAKAESDLTFYETLAGGEPGGGRPRAEQPWPPRERALAAPDTRPPAAEPVAPPPPTRPAAPVTARVEGADPRPPAPPAAPAAPAPAATVTRAAPPEAQAPTGRPAGGWTVQANPTRNRQEADAILRRLRGRGYDATVVRVLRDNDTWYRVQVGRFATSEQATEVMQRLREREGVTHVFVASE
jgi:cell division protein FtsN